jgi:lysozyme family protein
MGKTVEFDTAFDRVLGNEGGYTFNEKDPGGETKWGISKRSYPHLNIKELTREDAKRIYYADFWRNCGVGLHDSVVYQVFDAAVNHGIGNAIRMLQRAAKVADDGHWGPVSATAYEAMDESDALIRFLSQRLRFMAKLTTWLEFGRGWANRIADDLDYAAQDN